MEMNWLITSFKGKKLSNFDDQVDLESSYMVHLEGEKL